MEPKRPTTFEWPTLKAYFEGELAQVHALMERAEGTELVRLQGEARRLRRCLNLPETFVTLGRV